MDPRDIIIAPHISERSMIDLEKDNFLHFQSRPKELIRQR